MTNIRSRVEEITPATAMAILGASEAEVRNRNVMDKHVQWLAGQIKAGKWEVNGETIILDEKGLLLDGQHRLWAIVEAGVPVSAVVVRGVDRKAFHTIDTGLVRQAAAILQIIGETSTHMTAAALRWIHLYESGNMLSMPKDSGFTAAAMLGLLRKYPELREAVLWATRMTKNVSLSAFPRSALAFVRWAFVKHMPRKAEEFFDLVGDLRQDEPGTPTRMFRDWLIRAGRSKDRIDTAEYLAICVKAWRCFLGEDKLEKFIWKRFGPYPEGFPVFPGDKESRGPAMRGLTSKEASRKRSAKEGA